MIGIGIDTGGTYTDAAIYSMENKDILATSKALTTKDNLEIGISNALNQLPDEYFPKCQLIALSTTLATNACVENKGGIGKLVLIGVSQSTLEEVHESFGIDDLDNVYLLDCQLKSSVGKSTTPDWNAFKKDLIFFGKHCDCMAVVQLYAKEHGGQYEKKAAEIISNTLHLPVIMGHELFPDLNAIKRGAGALLNARLIPIIHQFLSSVRHVFQTKNLTLPMVIVRSDGSLMSEDFTYQRPVETLLCGPAASIMGAMELTNEKDALIVDMGGTTTDIAVVKNGRPVKAKDGIHIGKWKTFVKGLYVDTFGLGGDTAIHYDLDGNLYLENYRIIPICTLASRYPQVIEQLKELDNRETGHSFYLHEFFCLVKNIEDNCNYSSVEQEFCNSLINGPLIFTKAAQSIGKDIYNLNVERLEKEGIIIRAGLTPTDIMHIKGDFSKYDSNASLLAAKFISKSTGYSVEQLCDSVYSIVKKKLYCNIVRILLKEEYPFYQQEELDKQMLHMIEIGYENANSFKDTFFTPTFITKATLIGVGAPIHIFLEDVASMLGTRAVIPKHASVANAVGAIVGNVSVNIDVELKPLYKDEETNSYQVLTIHGSQFFEDYELAKEYAISQATELVTSAAYEQGAKGKLSIHIETIRNDVPIGSSSLFLNEIISASAIGKIIN